MDKPLRKRINQNRRTIIDTPVDPISYNEFHAIGLGTIGYVLGRGSHSLVTGLVTLAAITGYLPRPVNPDSPDTRGIGTVTVVKEVWWFVVTLVVTYAIGDFQNRQ